MSSRYAWLTKGWYIVIGMDWPHERLCRCCLLVWGRCTPDPQQIPTFYYPKLKGSASHIGSNECCGFLAAAAEVRNPRQSLYEKLPSQACHRNPLLLYANGDMLWEVHIIKALQAFASSFFSRGMIKICTKGIKPLSNHISGYKNAANFLHRKPETSLWHNLLHESTILWIGSTMKGKVCKTQTFSARILWFSEHTLWTISEMTLEGSPIPLFKATMSVLAWSS